MSKMRSGRIVIRFEDKSLRESFTQQLNNKQAFGGHIFWLSVMVLVYGMADSCLYNKQNNTWTLGDMEFIFSCSHSISHSFAALTRSISM